jgi:hypothetical protein
MNDPREWAISYLAARGDVPWRWADDGEVITWTDGTTIAFREEIAYVLEWLVPHGWPSFGALVWLLAASRGKLPPRLSSEKRFVLPPDIGADAESDSTQPSLAAYHERLRTMHATVEDGLTAIANLPESLRTTLRAKAVLAEKIFGDLPGDTGNGALYSAVVEVLRSGLLTDAMLNDPGAPPAEKRNEWLSLHDGLKGLTPELLALRVQTGLDAVPQAPELPPIASMRVRALLADLRSDAEHAGLARLARDFMAALQLPRHLSEPDEMPIGGFADIANRGSLDRLLLSELAHDDLTLAVRIALNEALYLRREPPAQQPPSTLAVLIDSGVRLWGVPRVLATAVALALIAKSARHEEPVVFRACEKELKPVDLLTRKGLISHLGALETHAHPGLALEAFEKLVHAEERADAVLITHRDVLADADFQRILAGTKFEMLYLGVVDREGGFELLRYPRGGLPVCQAHVNIEDLWPAPAAPVRGPRRKPLIDRETYPELPVCFSRNPFPLRIAVRGKVQASVQTSGGGGLCVLQDRRLLQWDRPGRGARTLAWSLPRGRTLWLGEQADGRACVIKSHHGNRQISCRVFLRNGDLVHSHDWRFADPIRRLVVQGDLVFMIGFREITVRSMGTGEQLGMLAESGQPSYGIYFRAAGNAWKILAWNGLTLELAPVTFSLGIPTLKVLRIFHRQGFEGPWCITRDGDIYSHEGRIVLQLGPLQPVVRISENGHRLLVAGTVVKETRLVDLPTLTSRFILGNIRDEDWEWRPAPPVFAVRVRFDKIAIGKGGRLHLHSLSGVWWVVGITADEAGGASYYEPILTKAESAPPDAVALVPIEMRGGHGFSVKMARWPDGRCAWLDDRGMLHLRSADRAMPEVTLVLSEPLCAWFSDNLCYGHEFFLGDQPRCDTGEIWKRIDGFCRPLPVFPPLKL